MGELIHSLATNSELSGDLTLRDPSSEHIPDAELAVGQVGAVQAHKASPIFAVLTLGV